MARKRPLALDEYRNSRFQGALLVVAMTLAFFRAI